MNTELVRQMIDMIKEFAATTFYSDALDLAKQQFIANPNTHDNWDALGDEYKNLNVKLAEAAIYELSTGKEIQ